MGFEHGRYQDRGSSTPNRRGRCPIMLAALLAALALAMPAMAAGAPQPPPERAPAARDEQVKQAKALNEEAYQLYLKGQYRPAITKLETAISLDPNGKDLVYNLAVIHERLGELDTAASYYQRYLALETDPKLRERTQGALSTLKRLEGAKKDLAAQPPPSASAAVASPPSSASPPPRVPADRREAPFLGGRSPWLIPAASIAVAGLGAGAAFGISALLRSPGPDVKTGPGISYEDIQQEARLAHRQAIFADISFAIGAAAAGAALYLCFLAPRSSAPKMKVPPPRAGRRVELDVAAGRAALRVVF